MNGGIRSAPPALELTTLPEFKSTDKKGERFIFHPPHPDHARAEVAIRAPKAIDPATHPAHARLNQASISAQAAAADEAQRIAALLDAEAYDELQHASWH